MALHLHLPIRVRIDAPVLAGSGALLDEALAGALDRAMRRAEAAALADRAGRRVVVHRGPAHWHGAGAALVPAALRRGTERRIDRGIAAALARRVPAHGRTAPEVLPRSPAEPFDPARFAGDRYRIDSYEQTGKRRPGQRVFWFKDKGEFDAITVVGESGDWWDYTNPSELAELAVRVSGEAGLAGLLRADETFGLLYRRRHARGNILWTTLFRRGPGGPEPSSTFPLGTPANWDVKPRKDAAAGASPTAKAMSIQPVGTWQLQALPGTTVFDAILTYWKGRFGLDPSQPNWKRLVAATDAIVANAFFPNGSAVLLLTGHGSPIAGTSPEPIRGSVPLLPLLRIARKPDAPADAPNGEARGEEAGEGDGAAAESGGGGQGGQGGQDGDGQGGDGRDRGGGGGGTGGGAGAEAGEAAGGSGDGEARGGDPDAIVRGAGEGRGGGALLPVPKLRGKAQAIDLGPFQGEPPVEALGDLGRRMRLLIHRIAFRIEMEEGRYPGAFALTAALVIAGRATGAADYGVGEGRAQAPRTERGNLGSLQFEPGDSQALRVMRHLAATAPLIGELARLVMIMAHDRAYRPFFAPGAPDQGSWALHFWVRFTDRMQSAVAWTFVATCQVILLQLLAATRVALLERKGAIDLYFQFVDGLMRRFVAGEARLRDLRDQLQAHLSLTSGKALMREGYEGWRAARTALASAFGTADESEAMLGDRRRTAARGAILDLPDGTTAIRDEAGHVWTLAELEQAIATRFEIAASVDPIVKHITDVPAAVALFAAAPEAARRWLETLLDDLLAANRNVTASAEPSAIWSFRCSRIREDLDHADVPGTGVVLGGVHKLAHEAIGPMFAGDDWYGRSLDHLFSHELGRASLIEFATMAGPLALGVICPPLGVAVGIGIAAVKYAYALETQDIPKAILDPDLVLSRAEAELELFMAEFELALSIIPEIGTIASKSARALKTVAGQGGGRLLLQQVRRQLLVAMAKELRQGLPRAFAKAVIQDQIMQQVIGRVLGPAFEQVSAEIGYATTGTTGLSTPQAPPAPAGTAGGDEPISETEAALLAELEGSNDEPDAVP